MSGWDYTHESNRRKLSSYNSPYGNVQRDILRIFKGHFNFIKSRVKYSVIALGNKDSLIQGNNAFIHCYYLLPFSC